MGVGGRYGIHLRTDWHVHATLQIEIQYLKDTLAVSQKKIDRYAQLGAFSRSNLN